MSSEKHRKRLLFKWTAWKGLTATLLFLALTLFIQYLVVYLFTSFGLTDTFQFTGLPISPLFHLLPLGITIVLLSSWMYLTKHIAVVPRKKAPTKPQRQHLRPQKVRFKSIKRFFKKISRKFEWISRALESFYQLHFAKATVKSTATIIGVFLVSALTLYIIGSPNFIHEAVTGFYNANPSFHEFVLKTFETTQGIGQTLTPIGWLGSTINNALLTVAPSFRNALEGFGTSMTGPLVTLDLVWKYVLCQNIAAWASALTALTYGQYATHPYRRHKRR
jgi:hypothetical protein